MLAASALTFAATQSRAVRLPKWNQMTLAVADQISAAHALERLAQQWPVLGIVVAQKGLVQPPLLQSLGETVSPRSRWMPFSGLRPSVVHGGGQRHRRGQKCHLIGAKAVTLQPQGEVEHVLVARARMRGDEVGMRYCSLPASFENSRTAP